MNTGLQDAYNLAWKLALAVKARAPPGLLDSYGAERRRVGLDVVERTTHRMDESLLLRGSIKFDQWMQDSQLLVGYRGTRLGSGGRRPSRPWPAGPVRATAPEKRPACGASGCRSRLD